MYRHTFDVQILIRNRGSIFHRQGGDLVIAAENRK